MLVTGGGNGIGRAIALRAAHEGAAGVAVADLDGAGADAVAAEVIAAGVPAHAWTGDVADDAGVRALVTDTESMLGPIDVAFANAGVGIGADLDTPDADWALAWDVNVRAHVLLARLVVPGWVERGGGWFISTASAAGLLAQIGSAPYSVTKHAAVAFAEWLSITYGDRGVGVSCLCPMGVDTALLSSDAPGAAQATAAVRAAGPVLSPEAVADAVVAAMAAERFLILPHAEVADHERHRAADRERWLAGMRRLRASLGG